MIDRIGALVAATAVALLAAAPAHADGQPETTERVYYTSDMTDCWQSPDASPASRELAPVRPAVGAVYDASAPRFRGVAEGGGEARFRWLRVREDAGCFVKERTTSAAIRDDLEPSEWRARVIVSPSDPGLSFGGVLSAGDRTLRAAPSQQAASVAVVDEGTTMLAADWTLDGGNPAMTGRTFIWRPVEYRGVVAWILATSVFDLPVYEVADLTSTLTAEHAVPVYAQPARAGEPLGTLTAQEPVSTLLTPTLGWMPVALDGQVGWVSQEELIGSGEDKSEEATPVDTPAEFKWVEEKKKALAERKRDFIENRSAKKKDTADESGLFDGVKAWITGKNPVAESAAKFRMLLAGAVALAALLFAGIGHAATGSLRRGGFLTGKALGVAAPGAGLVLRHATIPAAIVTGLVAAWMAPATYFQTQVLGAAGVLGLVLGFAVAHRVAVLRGGDSAAVTETIREQMTALVLAAIGAGAGIHFLLGFDAAACVLLSLTAAGAVAGWRTPLAVEADGPQPVLNPTTVSVDHSEGDAR